MCSRVHSSGGYLDFFHCRNRYPPKDFTKSSFRVTSPIDKPKGDDGDKLKTKPAKGDRDDKLATLKLYYRKKLFVLQAWREMGSKSQ
jgi:hypothetical protein